MRQYDSVPSALSMDNSYYSYELPGGSCTGSCCACFCPCLVFGKVVEKMRANRGAVDWTACISWALCTLLVWGGVSSATQVLIDKTSDQNLKYVVYGLYVFYYLGYMLPYMQALYMYKSLKGLMTTAGGQPLQVGQSPTTVTVPCSQFCSFLVCPCFYLSRVVAFIDIENSGNSSTFVRLEETIVCPFTCYNSYRMKVQQGNVSSVVDPAQPRYVQPQYAQQPAYGYGQQPAYGYGQQPAYGYGQQQQPVIYGPV